MPKSNFSKSTLVQLTRMLREQNFERARRHDTIASEENEAVERTRGKFDLVFDKYRQKMEGKPANWEGDVETKTLRRELERLAGQMERITAKADTHRALKAQEIATAREIRRKMLHPAKKIRAVKKAIKTRFG